MVSLIAPPPKPPLTQWAFTSPHEGVIPHLYLDTRRNVTCGVGFLVRSISDLDVYAWHPSVAIARTDWAELTRPGVLAGQLPGYYKRICCARLTTENMRAAFDKIVEGFRADIREHWKLDELPHLVQIALVDMAYQLGPTGLKRFRNLHAAVMRGDWRAAAIECHRRDAQARRNLATAALFATVAKVIGP